MTARWHSLPTMGVKAIALGQRRPLRTAPRKQLVRLAGSITVAAVLAIGGAFVLLGPSHLAPSIGRGLAGSDLRTSVGGSNNPGGPVSFDTGEINVTLPTVGPTVNLMQDANSSVSATFQVVALYEIRPAATANEPPTIVESALPPDYGGYNESLPSGHHDLPVSLSILIPVTHSTGAIAGGTGGFSVPVPTVAAGWANFTVQVASQDPDSPGSGVSINWSILSWPWENRAGYLTVEFLVNLTSIGSLTACGATSATVENPLACPGTALRVGNAVWGSSFSGLEGQTPQRPLSALTWGVPGAPDTAIPSAVGVVALTNETAEVLLTNPAPGSTSLNHSLTFSLVVPSLLPSGDLIVGAPAYYFGALAIFSIAAATGTLAYRRNERRAWDELLYD